jgi:endogenous inhibitor of DNA gyrase (YacG/DUF329 family)
MVGKNRTDDETTTVLSELQEEHEGGRIVTPQEKDRIECAIRHIQTSVDVDEWAVEIAVDAMQKQIPKKPAERRDKYTGNYPMYCPNCGTYVAYRDGRTFVLSRFIGSSRCPECGQAIDFGE